MTEPTNEQQFPEMAPGSSGMYAITGPDAAKMGPAVMQAFLDKMRELAEAAGLEVKVEPINRLLTIWWYPKKEETFLDQLVEHMGAVPHGSIEVEWDTIMSGEMQTMEALDEVLAFMSETLKKVIESHEKEILEKKYVYITWRPSTPLDFPPRTYLDAVAEEFDKTRNGEITASKKNMLECKPGMDEVLAYFTEVEESKNLRITLEYSGSGDEVKVTWAPKTSSNDWWDGQNGTPDEEDDEHSLKMPSDDAMPPGDQMHWDTVNDEDEYGQRG